MEIIKRRIAKYKRPDPETALELLRRQTIHSQCLANQRARIERKKAREEAVEAKYGPLDESIEDEVARFRKAKADGEFRRLFYPVNTDQSYPFANSQPVENL